MVQRRFDIGRQNESLLDEEHYNLFKILEQYTKQGNPNSPSSGPISGEGIKEIADGALWIDRDIDPRNSELKYYSNGEWNIFFKNRFKITQDIVSGDEPSDPIEGQLWIDSQGVLNYFFKGVFKPIKAVPDNFHENANLQGFEDFIIISSLTASEKTIIDNFSSWLLDSVPLKKWGEGESYSINQGCVHNLDIYICQEEHTSTTDTEPYAGSPYWVKLQKLFQYIVPNSYEDKFYLDGYFVHERCPLKEDVMVPTAIAGQFLANEKTAQHSTLKKGVHIHDNSCNGYKADTNVSVSFPVEMVEGKIANGVHVNPKRLHNVEKKFILIDKNNPIIEVPEENTEYYAFTGGIGKLLVKTDNPETTEYTSVVSNNIDCIKLARDIVETYDFIYTIHYEFLDTKIKQLGSVTKKRQKLNDDNYIWIGYANPNKICVFAQGLYYANDNNTTWEYDMESEYLYIKEKLQDYDNMVKTFDFSVIEFPEKHEGKITDNFVVYNDMECFRINLPQGYPVSETFIAFTYGLSMDLVAGEVIKDPNNSRILYIPMNRDVYLKSGEAFYCIVGTQETNNGKLIRDMYRGKTKAIKNRTYGVHIPIYSDPKYPTDGGLLLKDDEAPLLFVDGVLTFQKEIERGADYITIYGLKEGQDVLLLADYKDPALGEEESSERLIFEDTVSYATIPTPLSDATIVYVANSILSDASCVYTSKKPEGAGYHGEIRYHINYDADNWYRYDAIKEKWFLIEASEMHIDPISGKQTPLIDVLDKNSRGYTHSKKSISFLQNIGSEVCTYLAYKYSDSIEKPLLMGYCFPNGKDGVNVPSSNIVTDPQPFRTNNKHVYIPGRNELTVFFNGVRQNLNSPNDIGFANSKNREGAVGKNDEFVLAFDDETTKGSPILDEEGYYVYLLKKWNEEKTVIKTNEMLNDEKEGYIEQGYEVELISYPNRNSIFYVIEPCESGEAKACDRKILTFKDSLASQGAFVNNTYTTGDFLLTRGNVRVYINGVRQPFGTYTTLESMEKENPYLQSYKILDSRTIEIQDPLIGGLGGNEGSINNPKFPIGQITMPDGTVKKEYHKVIDEIVIEIRRDSKLREMTVPIRDNSGEFGEEDGLPLELFKTKDRVMIYINGFAYGKDYRLEDNKIKLLNSEIRQLLGNSKKDVITFEWR